MNPLSRKFPFFLLLFVLMALPVSVPSKATEVGTPFLRHYQLALAQWLLETGKSADQLQHGQVTAGESTQTGQRFYILTVSQKKYFFAALFDPTLKPPRAVREFKIPSFVHVIQDEANLAHQYIWGEIASDFLKWQGEKLLLADGLVLIYDKQILSYKVREMYGIEWHYLGKRADFLTSLARHELWGTSEAAAEIESISDTAAALEPHYKQEPAEEESHDCTWYLGGFDSDPSAH